MMARWKLLRVDRGRARDLKLLGDAKELHRLTHSKPLVELFFEWVDR
jgi:hypothetical protein